MAPAAPVRSAGIALVLERKLDADDSEHVWIASLKVVQRGAVSCIGLSANPALVVDELDEGNRSNLPVGRHGDSWLRGKPAFESPPSCGSGLASWAEGDEPSPGEGECPSNRPTKD
jgi:hypothetical protein